MTDKDEWNVCLKKLPHQYAVLIKTLVKASPLQDVSAKKQELLKQANAIMNELNVNIDKHKTFKISDFQKNGLVDPPYKVDAGDKHRRYQPTTRPKPVKKGKTTVQTTKPKAKKKAVSKDAHGYQKKPRKVRKDKGVKRGPQKNPKNKKPKK